MNKSKISKTMHPNFNSPMLVKGTKGGLFMSHDEMKLLEKFERERENIMFGRLFQNFK